MSMKTVRQDIPNIDNFREFINEPKDNMCYKLVDY